MEIEDKTRTAETEYKKAKIEQNMSWRLKIKQEQQRLNRKQEHQRLNRKQEQQRLNRTQVQQRLNRKQEQQRLNRNTYSNVTDYRLAKQNKIIQNRTAYKKQ